MLLKQLLEQSLAALGVSLRCIYMLEEEFDLLNHTDYEALLFNLVGLNGVGIL